MKNKILQLWSILLILIPSLFVFKSFFGNLHLAWGDAPYFFPDGLKEFISGLPLWSERGVAFGGRNLALWLSPIMILYSALGRFLHLSNDLIVRLLFYFPSVILAAIGPFFLTRHLKLDRMIQFFASLIYLLNTYFLMLIDGGQVGVALAYGIFPLSLLFVKKFLDNLSVKNFVLAAIFSIALCLADPRVALVSFLLLFIWQIFQDVRKIYWFLPFGTILAITNLFWILPIIKAGGGASAPAINIGSISLLNSFLLFAPNWPSNIFGYLTAPYFYFALVPVFIFGSFIFKVSKKYYTYAFLFLIFAFIAKGSAAPFGKWYELFVNKVPFGSSFRDSSKFFAPLILLGGILIGNTLSLVNEKLKKNYLKILTIGSSYLYILLLISPAIFGKLNFNLSSRKETNDLLTVNANIENDPGNFRTLWFNEKPQVSYETIDKPAISAEQLINFRPFAAINTGEDPYNFLNNTDFPKLFSRFGVKYLVLFGNSRNIFPTTMDIKNWDTENKLVSTNSGLIRQNWETKIPVYRIDNIWPDFYSVSKITLIIGGDLPPSTNIAAPVYLEDGKFDPDVLKNIPPDSAKIIFNGGNMDDLNMSFVQKYFKSVYESTSSQWARYQAPQYLKYKYELLIRGFTFNDFDYNLGIAFSSKKGEAIKFTFGVKESGEYILAKRIATNDNQKLHWDFEEKTLQPGAFEYQIVNESGLTVLNATAVIPKKEFNDIADATKKLMSSVGIADKNDKSISEWTKADCNNIQLLKYKCNIKNGGRWLIYTQNFDNGWKPDVFGIHIPVYSMINAFYMSGNGSTSIEFK